MPLFNPIETPEQEQALRDQQAYRNAQLDPEQQLRYTQQVGSQMMGRGAAGLVGAGLGVDVRSQAEQNRGNENAAREEISQLDIDPKDINTYYPAVIRILLKYKMVDQANDMRAKYAQLRNEEANTANRTEEIRRKAAADAMHNSVALKKIEIDAKKAEMVGPRAMQLITRIGQLQDQIASLPEADERRLIISGRVKDMRDALETELATKKFELHDAGGKLVVFDKSTGTVGESVDKTAKPADAKQQAKTAEEIQQRQTNVNEGFASLQRQYDAVVELHNSRGLAGVVGTSGQLVGEKGENGNPTYRGMIVGGFKGDDAKVAADLFAQVRGGAFLAGLMQLKNASKNGSTGLGSVTEAEGERVIQAAAPLGRLQNVNALRVHLKNYAEDIERATARIADDARRHEVASIPPFLAGTIIDPSGGKPNTAVVKAPPRAAAPAAPAANPEAEGAAPAAPGGRPALADFFKK